MAEDKGIDLQELRRARKGAAKDFAKYSEEKYKKEIGPITKVRKKMVGRELLMLSAAGALVVSTILCSVYGARSIDIFVDSMNKVSD